MNERVTGHTAPLVSIGLPTYLGEKFLRRAIDTLLAQTYTHFELIISDNASTDSTPIICQEYLKKDSRIRYYRQKEASGYVENFYFVLSKARGEYFMWAADDDWRAPEYIQTVVTVLENHPDYGVALSSLQQRYLDGSLHKEYLMMGENDPTHDNPYTILKKMLGKDMLINYFIYGFFRRKFLQKVLARPLAQCNGWDKILISEIALSTRLYGTPPVLFFIQGRLKHAGDQKGKELRHAYFIPYKYSRMLLAAFFRAVTSPLIPLRRKIFLIIPFIQILWLQRRRFIGISFHDLGHIFRVDYWRKKIIRRGAVEISEQKILRGTRMNPAAYRRRSTP